MPPPGTKESRLWVDSRGSIIILAAGERKCLLISNFYVARDSGATAVHSWSLVQDKRDRLGLWPTFLITGEDEIQSGILAVKDSSTAIQTKVARAELYVRFLRRNDER